MLIGAREIESLWSHILGGGLRGRGGEKGSGGENYLFFYAEEKIYFFSVTFILHLNLFQLDFTTLGSFHSETISMLSPRLSSTNVSEYVYRQ